MNKIKMSVGSEQVIITKIFKLLLTAVLSILVVIAAAGCQDKIAGDLPSTEAAYTPDIGNSSAEVLKGQSYSTKDEVALYIHEFSSLPPNFITKKEAAALGWDSSKGNLWDVANKKSIGGDRFGNREGLLPAAQGRVYYECDINYYGGFRGAERLVYSNDGLIFFTGNHYETFEQLYGEGYR